MFNPEIVTEVHVFNKKDSFMDFLNKMINENRLQFILSNSSVQSNIFTDYQITDVSITPMYLHKVPGHEVEYHELFGLHNSPSLKSYRDHLLKNTRNNPSYLEFLKMLNIKVSNTKNEYDSFMLKVPIIHCDVNTIDEQFIQSSFKSFFSFLEGKCVSIFELNFKKNVVKPFVGLMNDSLKSYGFVYQDYQSSILFHYNKS